MAIRRLYFEPLTGRYHALYIGDNINNDIIYGLFETSPVTVTHGNNTERVLVSVYEGKDEIIPDRVEIVDSNSVRVFFSEPFEGKIHVTTF